MTFIGAGLAPSAIHSCCLGGTLDSVSLDATSHTEAVPPDPEGIAFDARRQRLYWSSEGAFEPARTGEPAVVLDPWVRIAGLDGSYLGEFTMPPGFDMSAAGDAGPRPNRSLEGLTLSPEIGRAHV